MREGALPTAGQLPPEASRAGWWVQGDGEAGAGVRAACTGQLCPWRVPGDVVNLGNAGARRTSEMPPIPGEVTVKGMRTESHRVAVVFAGSRGVSLAGQGSGPFLRCAACLALLICVYSLYKTWFPGTVVPGEMVGLWMTVPFSL